MHATAHGFIRLVGRVAADWRIWRDEVRTENLINGLPDHIRKDIGWPEVHSSRPRRRAGNSVPH